MSQVELFFIEVGGWAQVTLPVMADVISQQCSWFLFICDLKRKASVVGLNDWIDAAIKMKNGKAADVKGDHQNR
jgi:hypothetical protein